MKAMLILILISITPINTLINNNNKYTNNNKYNNNNNYNNHNYSIISMDGNNSNINNNSNNNSNNNNNNNINNFDSSINNLLVLELLDYTGIILDYIVPAFDLTNLY